MTATAAGCSGVEEGQGTVGPAICIDGVPAVEMACRVNPGMSVLEVPPPSPHLWFFWQEKIKFFFPPPRNKTSHV
jgi:hypothetical protein